MHDVQCCGATADRDPIDDQRQGVHSPRPDGGLDRGEIQQQGHRHIQTHTRRSLERWER